MTAPDRAPGALADVEAVADRLDRALRDATAVQALEPWPALTLDEAYVAQAGLLARRRARGEAAVGLKLGFTSEAKMRQMGVDEVIVGRLTDAMQVPDAGRLSLTGLIHPRVEPEVAFLVGADVDLSDPDVDLRASVTGVAAALEVIDSRYDGFRFDLPRVVADNTSAAAVVVGAWHDPQDVDVSELDVAMRIDDETVATGTTAAVLGDPWRTLPRLAALARRWGMGLPAGSVVLAGAATEAVPLRPGTVRASVAGLAGVSLEVVDGGAPR